MPAMKNIPETIPEIIAAAGGITVLAERTGLIDGVRKWPDVGILTQYWPILMELVPDLTPAILYAANRAARGELPKAS